MNAPRPDAPSDLPVRWTDEGLACSVRPWRRNFQLVRAGGLGAVLTVLLLLQPLAAVVLIAAWLAWVLWDWRRDEQRAIEWTDIVLDPTHVTIERRHEDGRILHRERLDLKTIGRVEVRDGSLNQPWLVLRIAGRDALEVPIQNESEPGALWLARSIEAVAREARDGRGRSVREVLTRTSTEAPLPPSPAPRAAG